MDIKEAVGIIERKMTDQSAALDLKTKEAIDTLKSENTIQLKAYDDKIATLNTELAKKDATIGEIQGEVKELKAKGGRQSGTKVDRPPTIWKQLHDLIGEAKENFAEVEKSGLIKPIDVKTVGGMTSANLSSANYIDYLDWRPGMEPTGQTRFRDLVRTIQSGIDFVQFPRANTPIGEGSMGRQATESVAKPQIDRDYTMISLTLKAMAGYAIVSRQALRNIVFLQSWLPTSMLEQLLDAEDFDFANTLVGGATGSSSTAGAGAPNIEKLIFLIKNLRKAKFAATGVAIDPDIWASILITKPNDYSLPNVVTIDASGTVRILGRPVYDVNWLTGGRIIVGDWTKAAIIQSEGLTMRQSDSHASTFTSNDTTFLLERTEGLAIFRPDAFITSVLS